MLDAADEEAGGTGVALGAPLPIGPTELPDGPAE